MLIRTFRDPDQRYDKLRGALLFRGLHEGNWIASATTIYIAEQLLSGYAREEMIGRGDISKISSPSRNFLSLSFSPCAFANVARKFPRADVDSQPRELIAGASKKLPREASTSRN